ncbi:MAG: response regulator [Anaerolineae bacterium]|nr:response regulator [Anaerolineae bacterium]
MTYALIVDDDINNLNVLGELLSLEGVAQTRIADPLKVDSALDELPKVDVVFLDLEMPGLDGYTLLNQLRGDKRYQDVPFVACTVHLNEIKNAKSNGFHSFIGKPLDADLFPAQLGRILKGDRVWIAPR